MWMVDTTKLSTSLYANFNGAMIGRKKNNDSLEKKNWAGKDLAPKELSFSGFRFENG